MLGILNVPTYVSAHEGCTNTMRKSALKVDSGRKIPCRTGESNLPQRRAGPTLYQLSYIPTPRMARGQLAICWHGPRVPFRLGSPFPSTAVVYGHGLSWDSAPKIPCLPPPSPAPNHHLTPQLMNR